MADIMTIRDAAARAKEEGLPVSEYTLRGWVKAGVIPIRRAGSKQLIYYPNLERYLRCEDGGDIAPATVADTAKNLQVQGGY